jgi:recombination associated protein RdgC
MGGDEMVYQQQGCAFFAVQVETKILPASVIRDLLAARVEDIEARQGRKVYRKERLSIKDEIIQDALPRAFSRSQVIDGYFDSENRLLIIDTATSSMADKIANLLREEMGSMPVMPLMGHTSPALVMTDWLASQKPQLGDFSIGADCELVDLADQTHKGRLVGHDLSCSEVVQDMISEGMQARSMEIRLPEKLTLTCSQSHVLKKMRWDDALKPQPGFDEDEADRHAAYLAIQIPIMRELVEKLGALFDGWEHQTTADV